MTNLTKPLLLLCIFTVISCAPKKNELYDSGTSSIINLNPMNFATQITNNRAKNVISFVHFYKLDDGKSKDYAKVITDLDKEYEGMFKIAGINCKEYRDLCEKQDVKEFPSFMIYPPLPAPAMKYEGKITVNHIISYLGKFVENKSTELNNNNFDNFISSNPNLPKILLFTDKKNVPLLFKRLSSHFNKKIEFGIVRAETTAITSKYKVKKFPKIMAIGIDKKTKFYEGETKYKPLFDFCNIYQETFFVVGEDTTGVEPPKKPWMTEKFPEITKESSNDLCFKVDGSICVFLINPSKPNEQLENLFMEVQNWLSPKINRGAKYKFGWVNSNTQQAFVEGMKLHKGDGPRLVLINHGSRKRYHLYDGELVENDVKQIFEKLSSGDLRFTAFSKNTIPELNE